MQNEPLADKYLEELARSENSTFRDYVARSPKASPELLSSLATADYAHALSENPATPVEVLRKFSVSQNMSNRVIIARHPKLPIDIIEAFAQTVDDEKLRTRFLWSLARNPSTPAEILAVIMEEGSEFTQLDVARNPNAPDSILSPGLQRVKAASSFTASPEALRELARCREPYEYQHLDVETRVSVARNPNVPVDVLVALFSDPAGRVRKAAAVHPDLPSTSLLRGGERSVVDNPNTPRIFLVSTALSTDRFIRSAVGRHPNTPTHVLARLAVDYDEDVAAAALLNPGCPPALFLEALRAGGPQCGPANVAQFTQVSFDGLDRWQSRATSSQDAHKGTREPVRYAERVIPKLIDSREVGFRAFAAASHHATTGQLTSLSTDEDYFIRSHVARNAKTPAAVLTKLAYDTDIDVREGVALNPETPQDILSQLYREGPASIQKCVAENLSAPEGLLSKELMRGREARDPQTPLARLEELSDYHVRFSVEPLAGWVREGVARNPSTPIELLSKLALDSDILVQMAVARNPNMPTDTFLSFHKWPWQVEWLARAMVQNPNATAKFLKQRSEDTPVGIRYEVARHPNTPFETLMVRVIVDHSDTVRATAFLNPGCPEQLLESALQGHWPESMDDLRALLEPKKSFWSKLFGRK